MVALFAAVVALVSLCAALRGKGPEDLEKRLQEWDGGQIKNLREVAELDRVRRFRATTPEAALSWQESSRELLFKLLWLDDLVKANAPGTDGKPGIALNPRLTVEGNHDGYTVYELKINSTPTRVMTATLTVPDGQGPFPAIVCIGGHASDRFRFYAPETFPGKTGEIYAGLGTVFTKNGFVTISTKVSQHHIYEKGKRTLMGERLWDLIRCVDYLTTREDVDAKNIGCTGLSLGGQMANRLSAMDTRIKASCPAGWLPSAEWWILRKRQETSRSGCVCWYFPGLTENFCVVDIYIMNAPRALMYHAGEKDNLTPIKIATANMQRIKPAYAVFGQADLATIDVHPFGHQYNADTTSVLAFFRKHLQEKSCERGEGGG
ncbi:MAG: alpha/beta hydrolase family protein [Planctomycetota bacterium]